MKKDLTIATVDGLTLAAKLDTPDTPSDMCVILCHGLSVDMEEMGVFTKLTKQLVGAGFHVFRFDFRGHGARVDNSADEYVMSKAVQDVQAATEYVTSLGYKKYVLLAASFAGGPVSLFVSENPPELVGVIMWNALIDYDEKINPTSKRNKKSWGDGAREQIEQQGYVQRGRGFAFGKKAFDELYTLKPYESLLQYLGPVVFIHGDQDEHVRYSDSVKYADMMDKAELVTVAGAAHGFHEEQTTNIACQAVIDFINKL